MCYRLFISYGNHWSFLLLGLTGRVETLAICSSDYLWCDPCRTKASLGGLCGAHLGNHTLNVSICYQLLLYAENFCDGKAIKFFPILLHNVTTLYNCEFLVRNLQSFIGTLAGY